MSKVIDREGNFKGWILESGCGVNEANGNIQFVAKLQAVEEYDFESQAFFDITGTEEVEITAYLTIFGKDTNHPIFFGKQLKDALGWSGDVKALNSDDFSAIPIQFKVESEEYNGKTKLKVTRIDHVDAVPGGSVTKMDDDKLSAALARYSTAQRELMGGDKPAAIPTASKVAAKKAGAPVVPKIERPVSENVANAKEMAKAAVEEQKERAAAAEYNALSPAEKKALNTKKAATLKPPAVPKVKKSTPVAVEEPPVEAGEVDQLIEALDLPATCTKDQAWEACEVNAHPDKAAVLPEVWTEVVKELGYEVAVNQNNDWPEVRTRVLQRVCTDDIPF